MRRAIVTTVIVGLLPWSTVAWAGSDTEPPTLTSLSVTPNEVDTAAGPQSVTFTAVIVDDQSGVCITPGTCPMPTSVFLEAPSEIQGSSAAFVSAGGDTYTAEVVIGQAAEQGIWMPYVDLMDNAGNHVTVDYPDLVRAGISAQIGVGDIPDVTERSLDAPVSGHRVSLFLEAEGDERACVEYAPVTLHRRGRNGWRQVDEALTNGGGQKGFNLRRSGRYRVAAIAWPIGDPAITTCARVQERFRYTD